MSLGLDKARTTGRQPVPRGIATSGPAILSYGFRPFFLVAAGFAVLAMSLWIGALISGWEIGGSYGRTNWHAHEMLFGYASAALAGFMLTAIPNWTGRLPVSGPPLLGLVMVWLAGRLVMLAPELLGVPVSAIIDASFLPLMALVAGREIVAGRNWKNLKILAGLSALSAANILYHVFLLVDGDLVLAMRLAVTIYAGLIAVVGGRIVPSFTRNWLVKAGAQQLPRPYSRFDTAAITALLLALGLWVLVPEGEITAGAAAIAAVMQAARLWRWRGWAIAAEPILIILHLGYLFLPLGLAGVSLAALGWLSAPSALHLLTVGAIGNMTLAVMTRSSLGHTGRALRASRLTTLAYLCLLVAAVVRPFAELLPDFYMVLLSISAGGWILAFGLFIVVYGPILLAPRRKPSGSPAKG